MICRPWCRWEARRPSSLAARTVERWHPTGSRLTGGRTSSSASEACDHSLMRNGRMRRYASGTRVLRARRRVGRWARRGVRGVRRARRGVRGRTRFRVLGWHRKGLLRTAHDATALISPTRSRSCHGCSIHVRGELDPGPRSRVSWWGAEYGGAGGTEPTRTEARKDHSPMARFHGATWWFLEG
jgi:hypothetical protein